MNAEYPFDHIHRIFKDATKVNGYEYYAISEIFELSGRIKNHWRETGELDGDQLTLRICLFAEWRIDHFDGYGLMEDLPYLVALHRAAYGEEEEL